MAADSSKCAFDCEEPQPADLQASVCATCVSRKDTQQQDKQLEHQLAPLQEQYNRKQQEVTLLQAQVERLSSLLEGSSGEAVVERKSSTSNSTYLQQQLDAAHAELQHTRALLDQLMQQSSTAIKAACEQRFGALKLLLAEKVQEVQTLQQQAAAAHMLAAAKAEDSEAMRIALASANAHILTLTQQQLQQQQLAEQQLLQQQPPQHEQPQAADTPRTQPTPPASSQQPDSSQAAALSSCCQDSVVRQLQLQLSVQRQHLEVAHEQIKELAEHLALKHDVAEYAERRAVMLEKQLEEAQHNLAEALAAVGAQQHRRSCTSIAEEGGGPDVSLRLDGDSRPGTSPAAAQAAQQPQQHPEQQPSKAMALSGSFTAVLSNAASGFNLGEQKGNDHEAPPRQQTPAALGPFALARKFVADREADAVSKLKDELREREQEVASLTAAVKSYEAQFDGLQTILIAKVSQCNRLAGEVKDICKQLRQAEVAAASDHASMTHQLEQLSDRVAELEDDLAEEKQRGEQLEVQLAATSAKLAQVLGALVDDAAALQQNKPAQYKQLVQDMPAALSDVLSTNNAAHRPGLSAQASTDGHAHAQQHASTGLSVSRAASMPLETLDEHAGQDSLWQQQSYPAGYLSHTQQQQPSETWHGPVDKSPGLRGFMRSRTISSNDGGLTKPAGRSGAQPDGWGRSSSLTAGACVAPQKLSFTGMGSCSAGAGTGGAAAGTPKQSAASKLFEAFRIGKKGREEAEADAAAGMRRTSGSTDYSYVLLEP